MNVFLMIFLEILIFLVFLRKKWFFLNSLGIFLRFFK